MSATNLCYELPENLKAEKFISKLGNKTDLEIATQEYSLKKFYDSFDWRLFNAGMLCELNQSKSSSLLNFVHLKDGQVIVSALLDEVPTFAADFDDQKIRTMLEPILEMRALQSLTSLSYRAYRINILNKERKTTVRLILEDYELLPARIYVQPIRGYDKAARRIGNLLEKKIELKVPKKTLLNAALKLQGRRPQDYSSKLTLQLDPKMRADISCKYIYSSLLRTIKINEGGTIANVDSEFLHDFRVAVRRTRAGLSQLKNILPAEATRQFADYFAWLGQITGLPRDMDVYLLHFPNYQQSLPPDMRKDIEPLRDFIRRKQQNAQQELAAKLRSPAYLSKLQAWEDYLKETPAKKPAENNATLPIKQVADKRIWKVYQRVLKEGNAIDEQSPAEALHALRKTCKKLRYLMEFFQSLYPAKKIGKMIKALKNFQDILGDFQDYEVQEKTLKTFAEEMMAEQAPADTFIAMGVLVQNLKQKRDEARKEFAGRFEQFQQEQNQAAFAELFAGKGGAA
ncbi:CHAD domain-containing protein [Methylomarinum vadi]|uniref:CHAD domain-containing protein n=1 Tax=Methylomarinum vadi TaxID=438855 RepID=UPI0004DF1150|nr:CHAD domain-containing protein [Methylomarinum vadi]